MRSRRAYRSISRGSGRIGQGGVRRVACSSTCTAACASRESVASRSSSSSRACAALSSERTPITSKFLAKLGLRRQADNLVVLMKNLNEWAQIARTGLRKIKKKANKQLVIDPKKCIKMILHVILLIFP